MRRTIRLLKSPHLGSLKSEVYLSAPKLDSLNAKTTINGVKFSAPGQTMARCKCRKLALPLRWCPIPGQKPSPKRHCLICSNLKSCVAKPRRQCGRPTNAPGAKKPKSRPGILKANMDGDSAVPCSLYGAMNRSVVARHARQFRRTVRCSTPNARFNSSNNPAPHLTAAILPL